MADNGLPGTSHITEDGTYIDIDWQVVNVEDGTAFTLSNENGAAFLSVFGNAVSLSALPGGVLTISNPAGINLPTVPTEDPLVPGRLWSNNGVLTISAG